MAMTIPDDKEIHSPARDLGITTTPPRTNAWGLTVPRATTASGTSVSYINFDLSLSTQAHPHTWVGSPIVSRDLEPTLRAN